jgi:hypothetical protein
MNNHHNKKKFTKSISILICVDIPIKMLLWKKKILKCTMYEMA